MDRAKQRIVDRKRRATRVRKTVLGTALRPRMCIRRSLNNIYVQIIDDGAGVTLVQVSSSTKEIQDKVASDKKVNKTDLSKLVGELAAEKAKEKGIVNVVFDRKGYLYHGRVKALADAARSKGLAF